MPIASLKAVSLLVLFVCLFVFFLARKLTLFLKRKFLFKFLGQVGWVCGNCCCHGEWNFMA